MSCKKGHELVDGCECIECIRCEVTSCVYNDQENRCTADAIKVGPQNATSAGDTLCDTFKAR